EPFSPHRRAQVVLQEFSLVFRSVDARLPCLRRHGLVLNRNAPDGNFLFLVSLDELRVVVGPGLKELRLQLSTMQHVVVGLHECRWTPWTAEERELSAGGGERPLDEGNAELPVVVD